MKKYFWLGLVVGFVASFIVTLTWQYVCWYIEFISVWFGASLWNFIDSIR